MSWWEAIPELRAERQPGVIVTVVTARGHTPRDGGAKMVVSTERTWGTVGGGNLEATGIEHAHTMMALTAAAPELLTLRLNDKVDARFGMQCCGGEVTMLFEPLPVMPSLVLFGIGHVGLELARILSRLEVELHLVDSRSEMLDPERLSVLDGGPALIRVHHSAAPESIIETLPVGTLATIMTHDHAEDMALCDMALRSDRLEWIGLIGSTGKWGRFRRRLGQEGHTDAALERIHTPIGVPGIASKAPAAIAVSAAAELLQLIAAEPGGVSHSQATKGDTTVPLAGLDSR